MSKLDHTCVLWGKTTAMASRSLMVHGAPGRYRWEPAGETSITAWMGEGEGAAWKTNEAEPTRRAATSEHPRASRREISI